MSSSNLSPIVAVRVTPIAFRDPPLLNVAGVHEPWALRSIIEVQTRDGRVGLGESYGDLKTLADLNKVAPLLVGLDPFELNALTRVVYANVGNNPDAGAQFPPEGDKARASAKFWVWWRRNLQRAKQERGSRKSPACRNNSGESQERRNSMRCAAVWASRHSRIFWMLDRLCRATKITESRMGSVSVLMRCVGY